MGIKNPSFPYDSFSKIGFLISLLALALSVSLALSASFLKLTDSRGYWALLQPSIGVSAMHMQLLKNNKIVIFDRTDFGASNLPLPPGKCRYNDDVLKIGDCTAHSLIYDIVTNTFRPLMVQTDTWCSSGSLDANGTLIQTGGFHSGDRVIRTFTPCDDDSCDWVELSKPLWNRRWYATNQVLPDGRVIVVGGRKVFNYEFFPKNDSTSKTFFLRFLFETRDPLEENNLYPFLHLLPDGNLFLFANTRSILLDYNNNRVLKEFPAIPGNDRRNYPSTGSSVLLPLKLSASSETGNNVNNNSSRAASPKDPVVEVLICGGAPVGSYTKSEKQKVFVEASKTCGRLRLSDPNPQWVMEDMPMPRVMSDMILLPTGDVLIINGATNGTAGWEDAAGPVLNPLLYMPNEAPNRKFVVLPPSKIPRMYHSTALLVPDGRILVGGSNPHQRYDFKAQPFPTDLTLEAYHPPYLEPRFSALRPSILTVESGKAVTYGERFSVTYTLAVYRPEATVAVALIAPSFTTHSLGMNQRMVVLNKVRNDQLSVMSYKVTVDGPTHSKVAPSGYYMLFVLHNGVPSDGVWVQVM